MRSTWTTVTLPAIREWATTFKFWLSRTTLHQDQSVCLASQTMRTRSATRQSRLHFLPRTWRKGISTGSSKRNTSWAWVQTGRCICARCVYAPRRFPSLTWLQHVLDGNPLGHFAVKKIAVGESHSYLLKILREVRLLEQLHHPNIVTYQYVLLVRGDLVLTGH